MANIGIKELLDAGVHFGHQTRRWHPQMKRFIFEGRNGIHIIDLSKTAKQLEEAAKFLGETVRGGGKVLFVGTKKQAQAVVKESAMECGQFHITDRWLGGTLTNLKTIKKSLGRLNRLETMFEDGSIKNFVKQEQASLNRERTKLLRNLDGIRHMDKQPDAMFIVDLKREHNAVAEGRKLGIPIVALVDTNCDPNLVDYPIPGNDDAIRSVRAIIGAVTSEIKKAKSEYDSSAAKKQPVVEEKPVTAAELEAAAAQAPASPASTEPVAAPAAPASAEPVTEASAVAEAAPAPAAE